MTGDGVQRFDVAAEAFGGAGVDQRYAARYGLLCRQGRPASGIQIILWHSHIPGYWLDRSGAELLSRRLPCGQAAIQDAHIRQPGGG